MLQKFLANQLRCGILFETWLQELYIYITPILHVNWCRIFSWELWPIYQLPMMGWWDSLYAGVARFVMIYLSQDYQQRKHRLYTKEWYKLYWQHVLHNLGRLYFVFCSVSVLLQSKGPHGRGNPHCRRGGGAAGKGGDGSTAGNACDSSLAVTDDEEDEEEDIFVSAKKSLLVCLMFLCFLFMAPPVKVIALLSCFGEPEVLSTRWDNQHCIYM